ncbi:MAG: replication initiator protein [Microviridae sp.]|nr:MAG: replication initiator protein [Microviridae sp.]
MSSTFSIATPFGSPERLPNGECGGEFVKGLERQRPLTNDGGDSPLTPCAERGEATDLIISAQVTPAFRAVLQERQRRARKARRRYRLYDLKSLARIAASGIGRGFVQETPQRGSWDMSGDCASPVPVQMDAASSRLQGEYRVRTAGPIFGLTMHTRCRRCPPCLRNRSAKWAYRATEEIAGSARTWFATFTLSPHHHALMRMRASARLRPRGVDLELLPVEERIREVGAEYTRELTKWVKRIRKNSGAALRYMLVQEQHKSGLPHFHAVIHEVNTDEPVRHATLTSGWKLGFSKFKLVEGPKAAWYVAKYLAKDVLSRVRASIGYGKTAYAAGGVSKRPPRQKTSPPATTSQLNEVLTGSIKSDVSWLMSNHPAYAKKGEPDASCSQTSNLSRRGGPASELSLDAATANGSAPDHPFASRAAFNAAWDTISSLGRAFGSTSGVDPRWWKQTAHHTPRDASDTADPAGSRLLRRHVYRPT